MKKIKLLGDLQAFRSDWELLVDTPGEAMRAIEANRPGFLRACDQGDYVLILVDLENPDLTRQVTMLNANCPWANETLVVVPRAGGEFGIGEAIVAAVAAAASVTLSAAAATVIAGVINAVIAVGLSLAVSAIANAITGEKRKVEAKSTEVPESQPSFISNGPVNLVRQGHPYPIIAGEFLCGSIVVSSQIHVNDVPI